MLTGEDNLLTIDGQKFEVYLIKLSRKVELLDKTAKRTLDGELHRKVIGTYVNYKLEFGYCDKPDKYDKLWKILSSDKNDGFHRIKLPKNIGYTSEFDAYISSVEDNIEYVDPNDDNRRKFNGLSCDIISKSKNLASHL